MSSNHFPNYPKSSLSRDDIIGYLLPFKNKGWDIYQGSHPDEYVIKVTSRWNVWITFDNNQWVVFGGNHWATSHPENLLGLEESIKHAVRFVGIQDGKDLCWSEPPCSVRLNSSEPATNLNKLSSLIGASLIEAIFDVYLDNQALNNVLDLISLGAKASPNVRIITSTRKVADNKLTKNYVNHFLSQLSSTSGEVRHKLYAGHQRRFMLLTGGKSLIIGSSFNHLSVNEAAHVELNSGDLLFFNNEWSNATPV